MRGGAPAPLHSDAPAPLHSDRPTLADEPELPMRPRYLEVLLFALLGVGIASFSLRSEPRAVPVRTGLSVHYRDAVRSRIAPMPRVRWEEPRAPADPVRFGAWPPVSSSADPEEHVQLRTDYGF